jgi:STE24 endopeptidase
VEEKAKQYQTYKTVLFFTEIIFTLIFLFFFYYWGYSFSLSNFIQKKISSFFFRVLFFTLIFYFPLFFLKLFFSFFEDFLLEKKFSLFTGKIKTWFFDFLKGSFLELIFLLIFVEVFYFLLKSTSLWWVFSWGIYFFFTFVLAKISVYILPWFFKFKPIEDDDLKKRIQKLAQLFSLKIKNIFIVDFSRKTKKANAFVSGLGKSKKVALADNLINRYSPEEIEVVLAHEFAHIKNKDTQSQIVLVGVGSFFSFYFLNLIIGKFLQLKNIPIYEIANLPIFIFLFYIFIFLWLPFKNYFLRRMEKRADLNALKITKNKESFISLMEKLAKDNLAQKYPPKWRKIFYHHPPIGKRIEMAKNLKL